MFSVFGGLWLVGYGSNNCGLVGSLDENDVGFGRERVKNKNLIFFFSP